MKTIVIRLSAPLQSYGNQATFARRTTNLYPSKSSIIGLIAAALGYRRDDERITQLNNLLFAVRIDQRGSLLTDFQTVEYNKKKARKLTYRDNLQDAVFLVAICAENNLIEKIKFALKHPKFQLYLGRRANIFNTSSFLQLKEYPSDNPVLVLEKFPWMASEWYQKKYRSSEYTTRIIADAKLLPQKHSSLVKNAVGSFDQHNRYYNYRAEAEENITLVNSKYQQNSTKHDIFSAL